MKFLATIIMIISGTYYWPIGLAIALWLIGLYLVQCEIETGLSFLSKWDSKKIQDIKLIGAGVQFLVLPAITISGVYLLYRNIGGLWLD